MNIYSICMYDFRHREFGAVVYKSVLAKIVHPLFMHCLYSILSISDMRTAQYGLTSMHIWALIVVKCTCNMHRLYINRSWRSSCTHFICTVCLLIGPCEGGPCEGAAGHCKWIHANSGTYWTHMDRILYNPRLYLLHVLRTIRVSRIPHPSLFGIGLFVPLVTSCI